MTTSSKTEAANRHHGGPGSSHQDAKTPDPTADRGEKLTQSSKGPDSHVSGGGGEPDRTHGHNPAQK